MNRKLSILIILGCVVCVATLMLTMEVQDGSLKLRHAFGEPTHQKDLGYSSSNKDCQNKCNNAGGMSCGQNAQNCCVKGKCEEHWYGDICDKRVAVEGCTSA